MFVRPAVSSDVPQILALERSTVAQAFVGQWSEARHRLTMAGDDARYFVANAEDGALAGYAIVRGLAESSGSLELKRIVIATPGRGLGRLFLTGILRVVFKDLQAHRLFLDVFEDNARARHLYESLGFQYEGVMREAALRDGIYFDLHLMSMLAGEYEQRNQAGA